MYLTACTGTQKVGNVNETALAETGRKYRFTRVPLEIALATAMTSLGLSRCRGCDLWFKPIDLMWFDSETEPNGLCRDCQLDR